MDYRGIGEIDLKLRLLSGSEFNVDNLVLKPYILEEIKNYGYQKYMDNLQWLTLTVDDFINYVNDEGKKEFLEKQRENLKAFDFYSKLGGEDMLDSLIVSMRMIFRTDDVEFLHEEGVLALNFVKRGIIYYDDEGKQQIDNAFLGMLNEDEITLIHRDNFDDLVEAIKIQNYLSKPKGKSQEANPVDEETRRLMEDMERHRKRVEAKKKAQKMHEGQEDDIDITDIISAVSSKSNSINKLNIWGLTLYQLYDEYSRLELIDNYDFSIQAMMAGAEKVDLKHWSSRI
jgi:hypothetical protein